MPLVTVTMLKPKSAAFKSTVLDAISAALVASGVNPQDRFQRVMELSPDDFRFDATFPDLSRPRSSDFIMIEILLGVGRSVKIKKQIVAGIVARLAATGMDPEHVMVVFQDVPWENWSPGGGRVPHG
jgi:phenylpyruvate tautomerase PptA (4-oxalocrotonate tautomerase family)